RARARDREAPEPDVDAPLDDDSATACRRLDAPAKRDAEVGTSQVLPDIGFSRSKRLTRRGNQVQLRSRGQERPYAPAGIEAFHDQHRNLDRAGFDRQVQGEVVPAEA